MTEAYDGRGCPECEDGELCCAHCETRAALSKAEGERDHNKAVAIDFLRARDKIIAERDSLRAQLETVRADREQVVAQLAEAVKRNDLSHAALDEALEKLVEAREECGRLRRVVWAEFQKWNANTSPDVVAALSRIIDQMQRGAGPGKE